MEDNNGKFRLATLFRGEHRSFFYTVVIVTGLAVLLLLILPGNNLFTWMKAGRETARMRKSVNELVRKTDSLQTRIDDLRNNPDSLEKFARETYGFTAPGDEVFVIGD